MNRICVVIVRGYFKSRHLSFFNATLTRGVKKKELPLEPFILLRCAASKVSECVTREQQEKELASS